MSFTKYADPDTKQQTSPDQKEYHEPHGMQSNTVYQVRRVHVTNKCTKPSSRRHHRRVQICIPVVDEESKPWRCNNVEDRMNHLDRPLQVIVWLLGNRGQAMEKYDEEGECTKIIFYCQSDRTVEILFDINNKNRPVQLRQLCNAQGQTSLPCWIHCCLYYVVD